MAKINKDKIHKILVIRTDRMGDALLNIPAIRALKQSFHAFITALVKPDIKDLFVGIKEIDEIITFDENQWNQNILTRLNLLQKIYKGNFDLAVVLNPTKRFHILTYLAGIPWRLGYDRKWSFFLTHKIKDKKFEGQKHEIEYNLDLVRSIKADTDEKHISIELEDQQVQYVKTLLFQHGIAERDLIIAVHVHSSNPAKCWPQDNFAYVADELYLRFSAKVVLIGGEQERNLSTELISLAKYPIINLVGKLTLRQLAAFFQRCALLISNDSGPVHIAAAVGTPTIVIFGRNIPGVGPKRWGPWGNRHIILHKNLGCNPCLDRNCLYSFKCLSSITPDETLAAVEQQLNENINS
jgi:heptosyltransferase-1